MYNDKPHPQENALFRQYEHMARRAARTWAKRYKSIGSLTQDDLYQHACMGLISAFRGEVFATHPNPKAYLGSFCAGYITHAVHRKSYMVKPPYKQIKAGTAMGHASFEHRRLDPGAMWPEPLEDDIDEFLESLSPAALLRYNNTGELPPDSQATFEALVAKYHD
jgi:DNA-directed RNA polymerase specialized sigma24 family protein